MNTSLANQKRALHRSSMTLCVAGLIAAFTCMGFVPSSFAANIGPEIVTALTTKYYPSYRNLCVLRISFRDGKIVHEPIQDFFYEDFIEGELSQKVRKAPFCPDGRTAGHGCWRQCLILIVEEWSLPAYPCSELYFRSYLAPSSQPPPGKLVLTVGTLYEDEDRSFTVYSDGCNFIFHEHAILQ